MSEKASITRRQRWERDKYAGPLVHGKRRAIERPNRHAGGHKWVPVTGAQRLFSCPTCGVVKRQETTIDDSEPFTRRWYFASLEDFRAGRRGQLDAEPRCSR